MFLSTVATVTFKMCTFCTGTPPSESSQLVNAGAVLGGVAAVIVLIVAVVGVVIVVSLVLKCKRKGMWTNLS